MRPLTAIETAVVRWFAERVDELPRQALLRDLDKATAQTIRDEDVQMR